MSVYIDTNTPTVNTIGRCHHGVMPKQNVAFRALVGAELLRGQVFGIDTAVMAALAVGVSRPALHAGVTLLRSRDDDLIRRVLHGWEPLLASASKVRTRADLIRAFEAASPADHVAFGTIVGADRLFTDVVCPAL